MELTSVCSNVDRRRKAHLAIDATKYGYSFVRPYAIPFAQRFRSFGPIREGAIHAVNELGRIRRHTVDR